MRIALTPQFVVGSLVVAAAAIARKRRKILETFQEAGALSAEDAKSHEELGLRRSVIFRRLVRTGVLVDCGGELYYLDEEAAARAHHMRVLRVQLIMAVLVVVLFLIFVTANL